MVAIVDFRFVSWLKTLLFCLFFSNLLLFSSLKAQHEFSRKVSFQAKGEKLTSVLERLSKTENLSFSYNPGEKSFDKPITYSTNNTALQTVLKEIFAISGHDFRLIGGQIVIYSVAAELAVSNVHDSPVVRPLPDPEPLPDTVRAEVGVPVRDTLYLRDTIFQVDTLILRDTIVVEKEVTRSTRPERPSPLREDMFRFEPDRNNGWSVMAFYKHMIPYNRLQSNGGEDELLSLTREAETMSGTNYGIGIDARFSRNSWHITSGLKYIKFTNRFNYRYYRFEGGFFQTDTIDTYYTLIQADTTWHYVTDSTWVPLNSREFVFNRLNRLNYVELPFIIGYNVYTDINLRVWLGAGMNIGVLTGKNGVAIQGSGDYTGVEFDELDFKPLVLSYNLTAGARYRINEWVDIAAELSYRQHLSPILNNFPLNRRIGAAGLKLGVVYYL